jgi:hypothetical protein
MIVVTVVTTQLADVLYQIQVLPTVLTRAFKGIPVSSGKLSSSATHITLTTDFKVSGIMDDLIAWMDGGLYPIIPNSLPGFANNTIDSQHAWFRSSYMTLNSTRILFRAGIILGSRQQLLKIIDSFFGTLQELIAANEPLYVLLRGGHTHTHV